MAALLNELSVIGSVVDIMSPLSKAEQRRVLVWLEDYFGVFADLADDEDEARVYVGVPADASFAFADDVEDEPLPDTFETLYNQVAPRTAIQKICVAGYWLETREDHDSWKSFEVNKLLKSIDVKLSSVSGTLAIDAKKDEPLTVTLGKSGDSIQGRKTFNLSEAGRRYVEERVEA